MKIDHEYLKDLLIAFEECTTETTNIEELFKHGFNYEDSRFIFHLEILADKNLVISESGKGLGYIRGGDNQITWSVIPWRLTAQGHEFIEAIRNNEVWKTIQEEFKDASIETLLRVSKELLEAYIRNKMIFITKAIAP